MLNIGYVWIVVQFLISFCHYFFLFFFFLFFLNFMIYFLFRPTITNDENGIIIKRDKGMGVKLEWVGGGGGGGKTEALRWDYQ